MSRHGPVPASPEAVVGWLAECRARIDAGRQVLERTREERLERGPAPIVELSAGMADWLETFKADTFGRRRL